MNDLMPVSINTKLPAKWDYDTSVKSVEQQVFKWKNLSTDILNELWIAREMLSKPGRPEKTRSIVPQKTWNDYCEETGLIRRTVNRWLDRFNSPTPVQPKEKELDENISTNHLCPKCGYSWN